MKKALFLALLPVLAGCASVREQEMSGTMSRVHVLEIARLPPDQLAGRDPLKGGLQFVFRVSRQPGQSGEMALKETRFVRLNGVVYGLPEPTTPPSPAEPLTLLSDLPAFREANPALPEDDGWDPEDGILILRIFGAELPAAGIGTVEFQIGWGRETEIFSLPFSLAKLTDARYRLPKPALPRGTSAAAETARQRLADGEFDAALDAVQEGLAADPRDIECRLIRAALNMSRWESFQGGESTALRDLAVLFRATQEAQEAVSALVEAPNPEVAWSLMPRKQRDALDEKLVRHLLAMRLEQLKRPQEASKQEAWLAERYDKDAPWYSYLLFSLTFGQRIGRNPGLAIVQDRPDDIPLRWLLALLDLHTGQASSATLQLSMLVGKPLKPIAWLEHDYARALLASGQTDRAIQQARRAAALMGSMSTTLTLSSALRAAGRVDESIVPLRQFVEARYFDAPAWEFRNLYLPAILEDGAGDPASKVAFYDRIMQPALDQPIEQYEKGLRFRDLDRQTALAAFATAAQSEDVLLRARALNEQGTLLLDMDRKEEAYRCLKESAQYDWGSAWRGMSHCYLYSCGVQKDSVKAIEYGERAAMRGHLDGLLPSLHRDAGRGIRKKAVAQYRMLVGLDNTHGYHGMAWLMVSTPETWDAEAAKWYGEEAVRLDGDSSSYDNLFCIYRIAGEWDKADEVMKRYEQWWRTQPGGASAPKPDYWEWDKRRAEVEENLKTYVRTNSPAPLSLARRMETPPWRVEGPSRPLALKFRERETPTLEQKRWALAGGAFNVQIDLKYSNVLAGIEPVPRGRRLVTHHNLAKFYNIYSRQDLLDYLQGLQDRGFRAAYDQLAAHWASADEEKWQALWMDFRVADEELLPIYWVRGYAHALGKNGVIGYDLREYMDGCRAGYRAGYLTEEECWRRIMPAARLAQSLFGSWEEYILSYLVGFQIEYPWDTVRVDAGKRWILLAYLIHDEKSPLKDLSWDMDLGGEDPEPATARNVEEGGP